MSYSHKGKRVLVMGAGGATRGALLPMLAEQPAQLVIVNRTVAKADVVLATTQLKTTQAQAIDTGVQRAQMEHAIAILIGKPPAELNIAPEVVALAIPAIPPGIPSQLLSALPYLATILVLVLISRNRRLTMMNTPASLGQPFVPDR